MTNNTNNTSTELVEALDKVGISFGDLKNLSQEQFDKILEMTKKKELSKIESNLILGALPNIVELQKSYIDGLKSVIDGAKETQKIALTGIASSLDDIMEVLKNISKNTKSDEIQSKLIDTSLALGDKKEKIANILLEANKDNNSLWKNIIGGMAAVAVGVLVFIAGSKDNKS